jgi:tetratricopeptide (TPR) repeat protein
MRVAFLATALLGLCAAGAAPADRAATRPPRPPQAASGTIGAFLAGRFAAAEVDTATAADQLLAALRGDPDNPELLIRAFRASVLDGRAEALRLARRLPDNPVAILLQLGSEALAGRWDRAESRVRALPRNGPTAPLLPVLLAWTQAGRGQSDQAQSGLRPIIEQGRFRVLNALHAAMIADLSGRMREAERLVRLAMADQPDPTLRLALLGASILHRAGRQADATRLLDQVVGNGDEISLAASEPARSLVLAGRGVTSPVEGIAEAYVAMAGALRAQGANDDAMLLSRLALRLRPAFGPALLLVSDVLTEGDQRPQAMALLRLIRVDDPLFGVAALRRAGLLERMERRDEALALLREQAKSITSQPQPLIRMGDILRNAGRFAEAATVYDEAVARIPILTARDWPLLYARGIARERSNNFPGAEGDFLRALELAPEQPYVLNYLGYSWADQGLNLERARAMLARATELRPQDGNIADSLGWALFRLGDLPGAIEWLEKAVELEVRNSTINDHLGDAYWVAGREREAEYQWRRALTMELEPGEGPRIELKLQNGLPREAVPAALRR